MRIYPAIDIKDGRCVRLNQGDFRRATVFRDNPVEVALDWAKAGASYIHVVDLDGARGGSVINNSIIEQVVKETGVPVQTGGGIRTMKDIEDKLEIGVARVIIGTAAVKDPAFFKNALAYYGDQVAVGIDAINGFVAVHGWQETSGMKALELCARSREYGAKTIIYTDISKDGMMSGPNIEMTGEIAAAARLPVIASGGVASLSDLEKLLDAGVSGVIVGKALYTGALNLAQIIDIFEKGRDS